MGTFIGTDKTMVYKGEQSLLNALINYLDKEVVIYHNARAYGYEMDFLVLIPEQGPIIFEVKGYNEENILGVTNQKIRVMLNGIEEEINPIQQADCYKYKLVQKIRNSAGQEPHVFTAVCFPFLSLSRYEELGLDAVCEREYTFLKEDLNDKISFISRLKEVFKLHSYSRAAVFSEQLMLKVRGIYEPDKRGILNVTNVLDEENKIDILRESNNNYSCFYFIPKLDDRILNGLIQNYKKGVKIYAVVTNKEDLITISIKIDEFLTTKNLSRRGENLQFNINREKTKNIEVKNNFNCFNCSINICSEGINNIPMLEIYNGVFDNNEKEYLNQINETSAFNLNQFIIEHADIHQNIEVRAGAGTGKTFTMVSRIAYLCHVIGFSEFDILKRIVMITFTNEAAEQMRRKVKKYFENLFLLTGRKDCIAFVNAVDKMQICTIDSYTKQLLKRVGIENGLGSDFSISSSEFRKRKIIYEELNTYLLDKENEFISDLGLRIFELVGLIASFINQLNNRKVNIESLAKTDFGELLVGKDEKQGLHDLLSTLIPKIEKRYKEELLEADYLQLSNLMSTLEDIINKTKDEIENNNINDTKVIRLKEYISDTPQFMFIDEFQDTDDVQIKVLQNIADILEFKLFIVGDVKQCIYRFRGAKVQAFDQLRKEPGKWLEFSLNKNYRTDKTLLNIFDESFKNWGEPNDLLEYRDKDRLIGIQEFNSSVDRKIFYNKVEANNDNLFVLLKKEIKRLQERIDKEKAEYLEKGKAYNKDKQEIVLLVRENWQAEEIKKALSDEYNVITNTGGDLYCCDPAIDMFVLCNALVNNYDPVYLYNFVSSNFIGWTNRQVLANCNNDKELLAQKIIAVIDSALKKEQTITGDGNLLTWENISKELRFKPVLPVIKKLYDVLKPWTRYKNKTEWEMRYYFSNVELLFEELVSNRNGNFLTINVVRDILFHNIIAKKNVDSRLPEIKEGNESAKRCIKCMTVHKSKGLEFGSVILPFVNDRVDRIKINQLYVNVLNGQIIYDYKKMNKEWEWEWEICNNDFFKTEEKNELLKEEIRILYVAMTRAIHSFSWITTPNKQYDSWQNYIVE